MVEDQDLKTQEARENFIAQYIEQNRIADDDNEISPPNEIDVSQQQEEEIADLPRELATPVSLGKTNKTAQNGEKKKKKKKKKSKTANLPEAGSEIPDDYQEHNNEDVIENPYDPSNPLAQRIEYALWKYRKNHKFTDAKKKIFDRYLAFGGIKTGPNMFLGRATSADTPADPEANVDWEAAKAATDYVPDVEDEEGLEVNFTEVAQVFLGNTFIRESRFTGLSDFIDAPKLIDAFLRYLEIRNVAPEYAEDIAGARAICAKAKIELPLCKQLSLMVPGGYNKACTSVFGTDDTLANLDISWMDQKGLNLFSDMFPQGDNISALDETKKIVRKHIPNLEQVSAVESRKATIVKFKEIAPYDKEKAQPDELIQVIFENQEDNREEFKVYFEKEIVDYMLVGMVATVDITKLSNGEWFLDFITRINPTFYMEDECLDEDERFDY
ncbi:Argonaute siRNA chaperone complex subunit Arb1-domain-containing protein [Mycotypha africana]|uniref:Argonaute siRNA chaperone complex subunit Arb1-domain-containing protein n=1 Tax=Mycotypha africana TaxID=64632 RepID=UPI0023006DE0|nr:Argonaute siRNA chaperone complex subunit Arb1-domain-containing protein [Mycotypha africana]KAI8977402.1 Argonaute siRNA chaperone complex subunit Arb1-domain-containing protein [Mycotypha africana]